MTELPSLQYLGVGVYTVPEAARLTGVSPRRIRGWLKGYRRGKDHGDGLGAPVWRGQLPVIDDALALGFLDLMEVRFVDAFRTHGVSWKTIRLAAQKATELFGTDHPFAARRFRSDGRRIFAELSETTGERRLLDLAASQYAFRRVVSPSLFATLDFSPETEKAVRWWPLGRKRQVLLDPERSFGQPIVKSSGVPTTVLGQSFGAEESYTRVAEIYDVSVGEVRDAVAFERQLAA